MGMANNFKHMLNYKNLEQQDKEVMDAVRREMRRQSEEMEMIASENYVSKQYLKPWERF
jgi:glycine/serine hydroxymethyltransferase